MPKNKKNIVLVTTWYKPLQSIAVNRMVAFAKYLDKDKYAVKVVCLGDKKGPKKEVEDGVEIYRCSNETIFKLPSFKSSDSKLKHKFKVAQKLIIKKLVKDEYSSWIKTAGKKLIELQQTEKIDLIISSFAPAAPHVVVSNFLDSNPGVNWIADMRDEMSQNPELSQDSKAYFEAIESQINQKANAITTVSYPIVDYFKEILPKVQHFEEIRNGYDHDLSLDLNHFNSRFTIVYAGNFYGTRKPNTFFEALSELKDELPKDLLIRFVGSPRNFKVPKVFEDNVEFIEKVSQSESLDYMAKADVNLLIQPFFGRKGVYTGKLFDYASVEKPILAVVDKDDVAAELIKELNIGFVADFEDITGIKKAIHDCFELWKTKSHLKYHKEEIFKLHRKFQVHKLSNLIDKILNEKIQ
ncbi:glycosyltransferase family protein [Crocinitomix catalasitica]|uniref:hypothetical protein n=1 Tax=Crocinitomix catalasitica TaxID=184607 RepID=UPI0012F78EA0|nr:hypothetical protein [Crocinitomix catalasitica]